jgi:hypothetical protein
MIENGDAQVIFSGIIIPFWYQTHTIIHCILVQNYYAKMTEDQQIKKEKGGTNASRVLQIHSALPTLSFNQYHIYPKTKSERGHCRRRTRRAIRGYTGEFSLCKRICCMFKLWKGMENLDLAIVSLSVTHPGSSRTAAILFGKVERRDISLQSSKAAYSVPKRQGSLLYFLISELI